MRIPTKIYIIVPKVGSKGVFIGHAYKSKQYAQSHSMESEIAIGPYVLQISGAVTMRIIQVSETSFEEWFEEALHNMRMIRGKFESGRRSRYTGVDIAELHEQMHKEVETLKKRLLHGR